MSKWSSPQHDEINRNSFLNLHQWSVTYVRWGGDGRSIEMRPGGLQMDGGRQTGKLGMRLSQGR